MSEALAVELISFDDSPRPGPQSHGDAPARIGKALSEAGINVPSTLYNEALALARDGHLGQAQQRLVMLTCLDPDDGEAMLLLSRIHAAQNRWNDALARLDAATAAGAVATPGYRDALEAAIQGERLRDERHKALVTAREVGEIRELRQQSRALRSDSARLEIEVTETLHRERGWKLASFAGGLFSVVVIAFLALTGNSGGAVVTEAAPTGGSTAALVAEAAPPTLEPIVDEAPAILVEAATAAELASDVPVLVGRPDPADAPPALPTTHLVTKNDTLYKLAKTYYGDKSQWQRIADANPQTGPDGTKLSLGMNLTIPAP